MAQGSIFRFSCSAMFGALAVGLAPAVLASDMPPLNETLQHEFKSWQMGETWFAKKPGQTGVQPDGSIWWESVDVPFLNFLNKGPDRPRKWLTGRCNSQSGTLVFSTTSAPVKIIDPESTTPLAVTGRMLLRWSWQAQCLPVIQSDDQKVEVNSGNVGLFSCMAPNGTPLWHVAVTFAALPGGEGLLAVNTGRAGEIRLSLRIVDAKLVQDGGIMDSYPLRRASDASRSTPH